MHKDRHLLGCWWSWTRCSLSEIFRRSQSPRSRSRSSKQQPQQSAVLREPQQSLPSVTRDAVVAVVEATARAAIRALVLALAAPTRAICGNGVELFSAAHHWQTQYRHLCSDICAESLLAAVEVRRSLRKGVTRRAWHSGSVRRRKDFPRPSGLLISGQRKFRIFFSGSNLQCADARGHPWLSQRLADDCPEKLLCVA